MDRKVKYSKKAVEAYYDYSIPMKEFFRCALSVDCVVFGYDKEELKVLLIKRGAEPFKDFWALPGDLMYPYEHLDEAANRVLFNLTGISNLFMEQVKVFGQVDRHPVGRVITVGYYALVNIEEYVPKASSWAEQLGWHLLAEVPELAFDHNQILKSGIDSLRKNLKSSSKGFELLPKKFTLNDIQKLFENILGEKFDKANFRKKLLNSSLLVPLEENEKNVKHRPAKLYMVREGSVDINNDSKFQFLKSK